MTPYQLTDAERQTYRRYAALALPRHTSYPTAPVWTEDHGPPEFRANLVRSAQERRPLSLYVHIPFCERLCYYCACTREIIPTRKRQESDPADRFLAGLEQEADRLASLLDRQAVHQIHLGGGTPTFLSPDQLFRLGGILHRRFDLTPEAELAVEIDPRVTTREHLQALHALGFNRVSLGIQDFCPEVQRAVNRVQPFAMVADCVAHCRDLDFESINFDLIYGLPFQTTPRLAHTLEQVLSLAPDRIAFYRLAVIPEIFRWQNVFRHADLPGGDLPLELNLLAINTFMAAGYEFIGLDHFARPGEALARACTEGSLRRTFQGMTTGKGLDVIGLGPSAISQLDDAFAQNVKSSADWCQAVTRDFATERGLHLTPDDRLRRELLQQLYGHGRIDRPLLEQQFGIVFEEYFTDECRRLALLREEGLVRLEGEHIELTVPLGRLLVRVAAAVFDRYLPPEAYRTGMGPQLSSRVG
jgi:oxygen-independent coproporphyrinogen-3 oxidase